ncbi:MAG TPA: hypothetical protein VJV79_36430 [Polyangiaceae bacterium]|nr:hypothetical protein [Polyangiaceae bacterium]
MGNSGNFERRSSEGTPGHRELRGPSPVRVGWWHATLAAALLAGCVTQSESNQESPADYASGPSQSSSQALAAGDLTVSVRRLGSTVEIEVSAKQPFPDRAMPPILVVANQAFGRSRNPANGRLDTLIFSLEAREFDGLPEGAEVSLGYLHPKARLATSGAASSGMGAARMAGQTPTAQVRADQVEPSRRSLGRLNKSSSKVLP